MLSRLLRAASVSSLLAVPATSLAAPLDRGVDQAVAVHLPPHGLDSVGIAVERALTTVFPITDTLDTFECSDGTTLLYSLEATELQLSADAVDIIPSDGRLDVTLYATLSSPPAELLILGECGIITDLWEQCELSIQPTAIEAHVGVGLAEVGGVVEATADPVTIWISPITNPLSNCTLESAVGTLLGQSPTAVNDFLISAIEPSLDELPAQVEDALEGALGELAFETTIDLLGAPLALSLEPTLLEISADGILFGMGADITVEAPGQCIDAAAVPLPTPVWPDFALTAAGSSLEHDAGLHLSRDFTDELLTAVWASELLCLEIDELETLKLDGGVAGLFFGQDVTALLHEDAPAKLVVRSPLPPTTSFHNDQPAIGVDLDGLTVDLISEVDGRMTRLLQVGIDAHLGVDLDLVAGTIAPRIVVADNAFSFHETYSELVGPGYSSGLGDLVDSVLAGIIPDDALAELALPEIMGARVGAIVWEHDDDASWHGAYALLDVSAVEPLALTGCSGSSFSCDGSDPGVDFDLGAQLGCDDATGGCSGDGGACSTGARGIAPGPFTPLFAVAVLVGLRRRRERR